MRVLDDDLWSQVKNGELTGLSMGQRGAAARTCRRERKRPHMIYVEGERRMSQVAADKATVLGLIQEIPRAGTGREAGNEP